MWQSGLRRLVFVALLASGAMGSELAIGRPSGRGAGGGSHRLVPVQRARFQTLYQSYRRSIKGNENTWYMFSLQEIVPGGKRRVRGVVYGKDAAARVIAEFMSLGSLRQFFVEPHPSEQMAAARAAWWADHDGRSGYR